MRTELVSLLVSDIGTTKYADAWTLQQKLLILRQSNSIEDTLLLTEHEHVYTFGKGSNENHLLASEEELLSAGIKTFHIDRGGDVTYHGPGQIVGYPILDLKNYFLDIHRYLRSLEEVIIKTLYKFDIVATREKDMTGVWVNDEKIAAIGVKVNKWTTMHGFALNVNTDLTKFDRIIPCGIFHKGVTSMQRVLNKEIDLTLVKKALVESFEDVFTVQSRWIDKTELDSLIGNYDNQLYSSTEVNRN